MMKAILQTALVSSLVFILGAIGLYNYMPFSIDAIGGEQMLGSTITTINGSDTIKNFPASYNATINSLNDTKLEISDFLATTSLTQITTLGTITSGTWNADTLTVPYGGTGGTSFSKYHILMGNGTGALTVVATGTEDQVLTITDGMPAWSSTAVNETADYDWTGAHTFASTTSFSGFVDFTGTTTGAGFTHKEFITTTGTSTWSVPEGIKKIKVTVQGGGGNGGSGTSGGTTNNGGGGAGGYSQGIIDVSATSSIYYQVGGIAETTFFSSLLSATGGSSVSDNTLAGGNGGVGSGGDININGQPGQSAISAFNYHSGGGGNSLLGMGGQYRFSGSTAQNGFAATGYGSGGGGCIDSSGAATCNGGAGKQGILIIEY